MPALASRLVRELLARVEDDERFGSVVVRAPPRSPLGEQHFGAIGAILRSAYGIAPKDSAAAMREKLAQASPNSGCRRPRAPIWPCPRSTMLLGLAR
jgi:hypothetical protein